MAELSKIVKIAPKGEGYRFWDLSPPSPLLAKHERGPSIYQEEEEEGGDDWSLKNCWMRGGGEEEEGELP